MLELEQNNAWEYLSLCLRPGGKLVKIWWTSWFSKFQTHF